MLYPIISDIDYHQYLLIGCGSELFETKHELTISSALALEYCTKINSLFIANIALV
ncbi:hypothetical protein [Flavobacterium sp. XS2P39]|uniref:hypothetical protein n=1 Tax=Flavobacterium sp. XS2P39 TaxID=3401725 RepID=UPI003AABD783